MSSESDKRPDGGEEPAVEQCLEIRAPGGAAWQVPLGSGALIIGRASDCQVQLKDAAVSRHHAELFRDPFGRWWIHDLGSRNGTKVNAVRVVERVLGLSDAVEIHPFALKLRPVVSLEEHPATDVTAPSLSEGSSDTITSLPDVEPPKVAASQLSMLLHFGRQLLQVEQEKERMALLCRLMVGPQFSGRMAALMRLRRERADEPPEMLSGPLFPRGGTAKSAYVSKRLLRALAEHGRPVMGSNTCVDAADVELTVGRETMPVSAVACPLRSDERTIDFLYVMLPPEFGTSEWLALTALAAEQAEQAELAWAAREQAATHAAIEQELKRAREIQVGLIPRKVDVTGLDVAIGFEPCRWVAGDYVDVVPTTDGRVLLTVADVCGKGLQAALVAASVHSLVHAGLGAGLAVNDLMRGLNEHLCEYLPEDSFVTMICGVLNPTTGELEAVNAGHLPGMVLSRQGSLRWLETPTSYPLGVSSTRYECGLEEVRPGEMLAMFTDGLTEFGRRAADRSHLERLGEQLCGIYASAAGERASEVAGRLTELLDEAQRGILASDDRTFLLARRTPS